MSIFLFKQHFNGCVMINPKLYVINVKIFVCKQHLNGCVMINPIQYEYNLQFFLTNITLDLYGICIRM